MRMNERAMQNGQLEAVWKYKQEAQPGTALPATFPFLADLALSGYTTREDLNGADEYELKRIALLDSIAAQTVLYAFAHLPPLP